MIKNVIGYEGKYVVDDNGKDIIHYLEEYRNLQKMTRTERLIDVLRKVRGEK